MKSSDFWYYYKYYIIAGAFIFACIAGTVINAVLTKPVDLHVMYVGGYYMNEDTVSRLETYLGEKLGQDKNVVIKPIVVSNEIKNADDIKWREFIGVELAAGMNVVLIMDDVNFRAYAKSDYFQELQDIPENLQAKVDEKVVGIKLNTLEFSDVEEEFYLALKVEIPVSKKVLEYYDNAEILIQNLK